jgi:adenylate cyclase class IV
VVRIAAAMKNLEVKAVTGDLARLRRVLRALGARHEPRPLDQVDSYFAVPNGRLKVRQRKGERTAELLFYLRPDARAARRSEYQKLPVSDVAGLLRLLRAMFTPGVTVRKRRDLWLYGDARVHLDRVVGLGTFVEIEVPFTRSIAPARAVMRTLIDRLGITPGDVLDCSYADLLARRTAGRRPTGRPAGRGSDPGGRR